jgi:beta-fructofuranosidase
VPASGPLRIIIDGPVLELASTAGLFSAALRPMGEALDVRVSAGTLEVFPLMKQRDRE